MTETAVGHSSNEMSQPPRRCPECGSVRLWRAGLRYLSDGATVQRWLCRICGFRFSENSCEKPLNNAFSTNAKRRVRVSLARGAKNLVAEEAGPLKDGLAGATKPGVETVKGLITQYMAYLEREGYYEDSAYLKLIKRLVKCGANLLDPENVKEVIAKQPWKESVKLLAVYAYDIMAKNMLKIPWSMPKYTPEESLPFVPEEKELDQLIAACRSRRMAAYLQSLKETFADPGEVLRIEWVDIDFKQKIITINHPVKGHNPRRIHVSNNLLTMLNAMPKKSKRVFPTRYDIIRKCFVQVRKRAAQNLQNPRLQQISFKTFRHWGGTMIAHYTHGNVLKVKELLGHKRIQNTMKYIHMINFKEDEFDVATATTLEEIKQLLATGFEKADEFNNIHIYTRPKRFNA